MDGDTDEHRHITEVQHRLIGQYAHLDPAVVVAAVERAHRRFDNIPIRDFVPLLVERRVSAELDTHETDSARATD